jgi:hypothetical protein
MEATGFIKHWYEAVRRHIPEYRNFNAVQLNYRVLSVPNAVKIVTILSYEIIHFSKSTDEQHVEKIKSVPQ